ncbi:MAG: aminoacyl-tRNA hydrolase [Chloroflexota bacterium]|jgi:PTH1 family peptidyl-tRNA hydrolase
MAQNQAAPALAAENLGRSGVVGVFKRVQQIAQRLAGTVFDAEKNELMDQLQKDEVRGRYLVAGLGNPGRKYRNNRHNIGFKVADLLAERHSISMTRLEMRAIVGKGVILGRQVILAKPQTYMNESGQAIGSLLNYYDVPLMNLIVVYDEIDLPLGTLRLREQGGSGGHNGMKSIISHVGEEFPRLRLGVGRPPGKMEAAAYVLRDFKGEDRVVAEGMVSAGADAIESFLADGIELAMNRHNGQLDER